jgi:hypothetical protein
MVQSSFDTIYDISIGMQTALISAAVQSSRSRALEAILCSQVKSSSLSAAGMIVERIFCLPSTFTAKSAVGLVCLRGYTPGWEGVQKAASGDVDGVQEVQ